MGSAKDITCSPLAAVQAGRLQATHRFFTRKTITEGPEKLRADYGLQLDVARWQGRLQQAILNPAYGFE